MGLEIFMGSVWVGSLKRITEIGRDGDMYWMLKKRIGFKTIWYWPKFEQEKYRYNEGVLQ